MSETPASEMIRDHADSSLDMLYRRLVNGFAERPVDFNNAGLVIASKYTELGPSDLILDIGCHDGLFVYKAAEAAGIPSHLVGVDPYPEAYDSPGNKVDKSRFTFIEAQGEDLPLPDNSAKVTTAHNTLFRASDMYKMLDEMKRVTEPGGLLVISTNGRHHAHFRHYFEQRVAIETAAELKLPIDPPEPPARSCYIEDMPAIISRSGGLVLVDDSVKEDCKQIITRDRVADYLLSIKFSANMVKMPGSSRHVWRALVEEVVEPLIDAHIMQDEYANQMLGIDDEPHFTDIAHRQMFVYRNIKQVK